MIHFFAGTISVDDVHSFSALLQRLVCDATYELIMFSANYCHDGSDI
jgi:hypothetical protein